MPERLITTADFPAALDRLRGEGARLDLIYPADDPHTAILTHQGETLRLTAQPGAPEPSTTLPDFKPEFLITRAGAVPPGEGRAGMHYRDLIPGRLGGRYIASHITIPEGGPVADWVHYHDAALQLIFARNGWVRVVYQDQGEPFVMAAGDLVLQPPGIRHRVLESSAGFEAVEISCPAVHRTFADHEMALPNGPADPATTWQGQPFHHHVAATAPWTDWQGAKAQETGVREATAGLAEARILRPGASPVIAVPPHDGELVFGFVLKGSARLDHGDAAHLTSGDSFVVPPGVEWRLTQTSGHVQLLHVATANVVKS